MATWNNETMLDSVAERLAGDDPEAAGARTIIKRTLRKMRLPVTDNVRDLAGFFVAHPWACSGAIEQRIDQSKRAYERGDNAGELRAAAQVERLMSLIDVKLSWPGLYPTYIYTGEKPAKMAPGLFCREHYDLSQLWRLLKDIRAAEGSAE